VFGGAALVLAAFVPIDQVTAEDAAPVDSSLIGSKAVVESETGSYIVVMRADPLVASIPQDDLDTPAADAQAAALEGSHDQVLAESGVSTATKVQDFTNALNGFSAVMSYDQAVKVAANQKVSLVLPDELRQVTKDDGDDDDDGDRVSRKNDDLGNFLGLTAKGEAWRSGITGEGVTVGVIDTGIWPEHPSFADDGTYPPHVALDSEVGDPCDFGNTAANPNDADFTCNNKLVGARQVMPTYRALIGADDDEFDSARDDDGHGTHTASTAAGNADVRPVIFGRQFPKISGIAPRAQIIAYKALGNLGGFTSDLAAAIDQAVEDGVDVINYSIGGGAQLVSPDTIAFLFAADAGVFVAVSAGNSGPGPETIGGPADVPWVTAVGANTQRRFFEGTIKLDRGKEISGSSITRGTGKLPLVDAADAGNELCLPDTLDPAKVAGKIVLCRRGGNGRVDKSFSVFNAGGKGMILYNASDDDNLFTDNFWVPTVHIDLTPGLQVKNYIATSRRPRAQIKTEKPTTIDYAPSMTIFSSRGPNPTAADIIKPDITAPGLQVMAGASPFTDPGVVPGELFQAIAGTSMSSPVTAGMYALIKQAHPDWSAAAAKSALMSTANTDVRDNDRVTQAGPFAMGAGMVNPGKVAKPGSAFNPGLIYEAGFFEYLGFLCEAGPEIFGNPTGTCGFLESQGVPTTAQNLNYPSIGISQVPGAATVTRTVTSVASKTVTFSAAVTAPTGYGVTVTPDTFTLAPGDTATYEVTFTNAGAPIGEWAFGDLTWSGSGYHVRSPIALKGVQIKVPAEVSGTGTSGNTSFDVQFGYTGAYSAAAHGLVAATPNNGEVFQDRDQTPFTTDDGAGLVMIPFVVDDVAVARWTLTLPPDNEDDLDLYLLNSAGDIVAQSTNGGTDEFIELQQPANDTYTMAVHGWSVTEDPAPVAFSLQSWLVPNATGGSLVIDSAPTEAVIGTTGTIDLSWANLVAGGSYLGAVTHHDDAGLIATTVVNVTT
jgi:subtilisin family serine protease